MYHKCRSALTLCCLFTLVACDQPKQTAPTDSQPKALAVAPVEIVPVEALPVEAVLPTVKTAPLLPLSERDYAFGYWLNGMRKHAGDTTAEVLCFETGHYGFSVDMANLTEARFGRFKDVLSYTDALAQGVDRMKALESAALEIELESKGTVFRAVSSKTGSSDQARPQVATRMWESGRLVQRYDLLGLDFESADGRPLGLQGTLDIVAWPESLSLTATIAPSVVYQDGWTPGLVDKALCVVDKPWKVEHDPRLENETLTVEFWVKVPKELENGGWGYLLAKNRHQGIPGYFSFVYSKNTVSVNMNFGPEGKGLRSIKSKGHTFKADAWNHLAMTYDGNEMHYYINGNLQGTQSVGIARPLGQGALSLGQQADGNGSVLPALFDQVRVWDRALTAQELQSHVNAPEQVVARNGLRYAEDFDRYSNATLALPVWNDVTMRIRLKTTDKTWEQVQLVGGEWPLWEQKQLTLNCDITNSPAQKNQLAVKVSSAEDTDHPVVFDALYNAYGVEVRKVARSWDARDPKKSGYDDYDITLNNTGEHTVVAPLFFDLYDIAGVTGVTAILCDAEGRPTGVPVQLSKNWHEMTIGQYVRCFASIPVAPGTSHYRLRLAYGFYGTLPAASHAQLSLIGWGNHGRWDQLAIGSWGETICFDTDMSCVDVAITDVRMLMARNGADGKEWTWTDAGWGGDWLGAYDAQGKKLATTEMKAAYHSQGPCLTDVRFNGHYGSEREVAVQSDVSTLRTDDYARTFFKIRYDFDQALSAEKGWLFKMGRTGNSISPNVAYGHRDGLLEDVDVPLTLKKGEALFDRKSLEGAAPWWVGFPGGYLTGDRDWGTGSRALIIRSYKASFGGVTYDRPSISAPVLKADPDAGINLDLLLTAPEGVTTYQVGDYVEMEVEFITFHRTEDDYYGPNEIYRQHLVEHPNSWKTIYREASGNDLDVQVEGGELLSAYPIVVQAMGPVIGLTIHGGIGKVPLRIEGLTTPQNYQLFQFIDGKQVPLDQSAQGNDFWQTDYDLSSMTYRMSYNLPLDEGGETRWVLRQAP